ncbi:MAG TPA: Uma2 family endonuclease [Gemmataceae bacterium]|nr:Uma2 family endonuclease [Gemmataceae bacterium]
MRALKFGPSTVDLPYTLRLYGVTERKFDSLTDEDTKAELIDGVMIVHSPASPRHDNIAGLVRFLMRGYTGAKRLGLVLGPDSLIRLRKLRKVAPDGLFIRQKRVPRPLPEKQFELVPDLVFEVLSPSNRDVNLEIKWPAYRQAGVPEIWLIDPDNEEVVVDYRGKEGSTETRTHEGRVASTVLQGFWLDAAWLGADPLPNEMDCLQAILK